MHTVNLCILLLACTVVCASQVIKNCRCITTRKVVKVALITNVTVYDPRPYCNKKEIIVTMKDRSLQCLDPKTRFTQSVMKAVEVKKAARAGMNYSGPKTTTESANEAAAETVTLPSVSSSLSEDMAV